MSIKKKLSHLISGQLPEFVRAEYPQFVKFLEYYYKFLEQASIGDLQLPGVNHALLNSEDWRDIDKTLDLFVPYYRNQFIYDIPSDTIINNRKLIKYINQYYEGKGSENATEMFFRFMFNDTVSVEYPGDYILRASDGRWNRKKFIKVETTNFPNNNIYELLGKIVTLRYIEYIAGAGTFERSVTTRCFDVFQSSRPKIFQLEVDLNPDYIFPDYIESDTSLAPSLGNYDTHVYVQYINGAQTTTYGTVSKQITGVVSVDNRGSRFARDDSYFISETGVEGNYFAASGSESYVVNLTGPSAYVFELLQNNAVVRVVETRNTVAEQYFQQDYTIYGDYASAPVRGLLHQLAIIDTGEKFLARNDNDEPVKTFTVDLTPRRRGGADSTVTFKTGLVYHAPGEYKDNSGFLSDIVKLQDNDYYQPYSYVIQTTKPLNTWKDVYLNSTHPAGFKLFADLVLVGEINAASQVSSEITSIIITDSGSIAFNTLQGVTDSISLQPSLPFESSVSTSDVFSTNLAFTLNFLDTVTTIEERGTELNKLLTDATATSDNFQRQVVAYNIQFSDDITTSDVLNTINTELGKSEDVIVVDSSVLDFQQQNDPESVLTENLAISELFSLQPNKNILSELLEFDSLVLSYSSNQSENIANTETVTVNFAKNISENVTVVDSYINNYSRGNIPETLSLSDDITVLLVIPVDLSDTQGTIDSATVEARPGLSDATTTSDVLTFNVTTALSDSISTTELFQFAFSQNNDVTSVLLDVITFSETITFTYAVTETETVNSTDTLRINYSTPISETVSSVDTVSYNLSVPFNNDEVSTIEIVSKATNITVPNENVSNTDSIVINTNIQATDTQSIQDLSAEYFMESYFEGHENSLSPYVISRYVGTISNF